MGLLASCAKEMEPVREALSDVPGVQTTIQVGIDPVATKTYMGALEAGAHKVYWSDGDQIAINGAASEALAGVPANSQKATFSFTGTLVTPYNVLYPAADYTDATHITLPDNQTWKSGNFADNMVPMAGYSADGSNISVKYLCSLLKVSILRKATEADEDNLAAVYFKGGNNEQVKGLFTVDYANGTLTGASGSVDDKMVKVSHDLATSTSSAAVYYITVPAGTYSSGFSLIVQDVNNHCMTMSKGGSVTLTAGKIYNLAEFAFDPDGTYLSADIEIASAEELVAFATAYNAKTYDSQAVKLTADITFNASTSAAFNATGGIGLKDGINGTEDYYFSGVLDGDGHTISGLTATVPLFCATGSSGAVKNLTLDNTCSFNFTHPNTAEIFFGSIVGYHKGKLENVSVAADINLAAVDDVQYMTSLGGLAGRVTVGRLSSCEYSGLISTPSDFTVTAPGEDANNRKLIIGGLVGRFSNAGSVTGSAFKGAISNEAMVMAEEQSDKLKRNPYTIIGGVVGYLDGGATISSCITTADHAKIQSAHSGSTSNGHIVTKTTRAYNTAVGGIVGEANNGTVSDCTNAAEIFNSIFKVFDQPLSTDDSRYMKVGGIVGKNNAKGTISNCVNNGSVQHRSNPKMQDIAGIAGYNAGSVTSCTNNAAVNHMTTGVSGATKKGGRIVNIAGIIGENIEGATVSDVHNTANIQISAMESGTGSEARMGGVIAYNAADIDGGGSKNITNSGQVYFSPYFNNQFLGYELGGIVGSSTASVKNARNSGYVLVSWNTTDAGYVASKFYIAGVVGKMDGDGTIAGCENVGGDSNAGEVYFNVKASSLGHTDNYIGGILGYSASTVTLSDCVNSGYVHGGNSTNVVDKTCFTGGIVAYLGGASSSITNCDNSGVVYNNQRNNTDTNTASTYNGGVAGYLLGTSEGHITVTGCDNTATGMFSRRGWLGGVVGYAEYADLTNCSFNKDVTLDCLCRGIGGIVGWGVYTTVTSSTFSGVNLSATQIQANRAGGIAGKLENGTVDGCYSHVETLMSHPSSDDVPVAGGAIVGISGDGNTIQNCHYKSEINGEGANIVGTGSFSGSGNVADL